MRAKPATAISYSMNYYMRLDLEYDGEPFSGWQSQTNGVSIQSAVEKALATFLGCERIPVTAAGRTDAGVHALAQTASFTLKSEVALAANFNPSDEVCLGRMLRGMNGILPEQISVKRVALMRPTFHARRDAAGKTYEYAIVEGPAKPALLRKRAWHVFLPMDFDKMKRAAKCFVGFRDFATFKGRKAQLETTTRVVESFSVERSEYYENLILFTVTGDGFLKNMVRIMVGTLVDVGRGKLAEEDVPNIIASLDRTKAGQTAPACGLTLVKVYYNAPYDAPLAKFP